MKAENKKKDDNFKVYQEYNLILRAWFVSFGVGAPAIFLINDNLYEKLIALKEVLPWIIYPFLLGLFLQVFITFINKTVNWSIYFGEENDSFKSSCLFKCSNWLSEKYWVDLGCDLVTIAAFSVAIINLTRIFVINPPPTP
jgi:hypothetical protein